MNFCSSGFNSYCNICGRFTFMPSRRRVSDEIAEKFEQYFNMTMTRNVQWAPSIVCTGCVNKLRDWYNGKRECMPFGVPMLWYDPGVHNGEKCYSCVNFSARFNRSKLASYEYQSVPSAQTPLPHSENVPVPKKPSPTEEYLVPPTFESVPESSLSIYQPSEITPPCRHIEITQNRLDLMTRQLKLSQTRQILLTQHLKAVNILAPGVRIYDARGRQREYLTFFSVNEKNSFAYCNNIRGLMIAMGHEYDPNEWRLFIDSSKRSLKAVLLFVDNKKNPVPVAISSDTKETFESMRNIINSIKYKDHLWKICADLKVISLLRGLQLGYTKNMCFICEWNSRATNQYDQHDWASRQDAVIGQQNVVNVPLVPVEKILLPPLHIKLGLVKSFIKTIGRNNDAAYHTLIRIFPRLSTMKIKEG